MMRETNINISSRFRGGILKARMKGWSLLRRGMLRGQRQGTFFRMAVIELKGVRGHEEGSGHYGKRGEWNQSVDSLSFKAKKTTVKLSSQHRETLSVCVVFVTCVDH